jgi:hypothetical protein
MVSLVFSSDWVMTAIRAYCQRNMNPYAPPTSSLPQTPQPQRVDLKNPSRFLLYPLAAICIFFSLTTGAFFLLNGFKFRAAHFLNAGIGVLEVLFGISAFLLASRNLSKKTRFFTILWSFAAVSLLAVGVYFDPPSSIQELVLILVIGSILLLVGLLAYLAVAREHL